MCPQACPPWPLLKGFNEKADFNGPEPLLWGLSGPPRSGPGQAAPCSSQLALCLPPQKPSSGSPPLPPGRSQSWKRRSGVIGLSRWVLQGLSNLLWDRGKQSPQVGDLTYPCTDWGVGSRYLVVRGMLEAPFSSRDLDQPTDCVDPGPVFPKA